MKPALRTQAVETELPTSEFEFVEHATHVDSSSAPTDAEYVPIPQSMHSSVPAVVLYFPGTQSKHSPPFGPVDPALHVQSRISLLDAGASELLGHCLHALEDVAPSASEYWPCKQLVHASEPDEVLYVPAWQITQIRPLGPVDPALHAQSVRLSLALGASELAGHTVHTSDEIAPD